MGTQSCSGSYFSGHHSTWLAVLALSLPAPLCDPGFNRASTFTTLLHCYLCGSLMLFCFALQSFGRVWIPMIQQPPRIFRPTPSQFHVDDSVESTTAKNAPLSCLPSEQRYRVPHVGQAALSYIIYSLRGKKCLFSLMLLSTYGHPSRPKMPGKQFFLSNTRVAERRTYDGFVTPRNILDAIR